VKVLIKKIFLLITFIFIFITAFNGQEVILQYRCSIPNELTNQISFFVRINNNSNENIPLNELEIRYYYTIEDPYSQQYYIDWAQIGADNILCSFIHETDDEYYFKISFTNNAPSISSGNTSGDIQLRFNKTNWSNFNQANDYSFDSVKTNYTNFDKITLYRNGQLIWGVPFNNNNTENLLPYVNIVSPVNGSSYLEGDNIVIKSDAVDQDGYISKVEFYKDDIKLGEDTTYPYEYVWNNIIPGSYNIKVKATDNLGAFSYSNVTNFYVEENVVNNIELPGLFEAEDYNTGSEGVSYHDTSTGNTGGAYRNDDVDIESCGEGGYNIGWLDAGEWLKYDVSITETGYYNIEARTARLLPDNGTFHIELDGQNITGTINAPSTGGWQDYTSVVKTDILLNQGNHTITLFIENGPFNINWVNVKKSDVNNPIPLTIKISTDSNLVQSVRLTPAPTYSGNNIISGVNGYTETVYYSQSVNITLEALANDTDFVSWSGAVSGNNTIISYSLNEASTIQAGFKKGSVTDPIALKIKIYTDGSSKSIILSPPPTYAGNAIIEGSNDYEETVYYKDPVEINITASDGFVSWSGDISGNNNPVLLYLDNISKTINASFINETDNNDDWLFTNGNKIVDKNGNIVRLTGISYFGYETELHGFDGLMSSNLEENFDLIADLGFNIVRIPISIQLITQWRNGNDPIACLAFENIGVEIDYNQNPDLQGITSLQMLDRVVAYCKHIGLKIMFDMHRVIHSGKKNIWYYGEYTLNDFYLSWEWLTERYKNDDTVIAMDIFNEPHGCVADNDYNLNGDPAIWDGSNKSNNWKYVVETVAERIHNINPNVLIMVEGVQCYPKPGRDFSSMNTGDYYYNWWGGNLRGAADYPINLGDKQNKLVYEPHDYGPGVWAQPWFQGYFDNSTLYNDVWYPNWFFIHNSGMAPLIIGEWGSKMEMQDDIKWFNYMADFIKNNELSYIYWCFNPTSWDTGGIVLIDYKTVHQEKYNIVKTTLWRDNDDRAIGLDHKINLGYDGTNITQYYDNK